MDIVVVVVIVVCSLCRIRNKPRVYRAFSGITTGKSKNPIPATDEENMLANISETDEANCIQRVRAYEYGFSTAGYTDLDESHGRDRDSFKMAGGSSEKSGQSH